MMKATKVSTISHQVRVIRVSRSAVRPIKREESMDSRIPSSVESWLSSASSTRELKIQETPKNIITKPSTITDIPEKHFISRRCMVISIVILTVLVICFIIGLILAIKLQSTAANEINSNTSH